MSRTFDLKSLSRYVLDMFELNPQSHISFDELRDALYELTRLDKTRRLYDILNVLVGAGIVYRISSKVYMLV